MPAKIADGLRLSVKPVSRHSATCSARYLYTTTRALAIPSVSCIRPLAILQRKRASCQRQIWRSAQPNFSSPATASPTESQADEAEYDEWEAISALESRRKQLDWRPFLQTKEQYDYESDMRHAGAKLIDKHAGDFELWQELFLYRYKTHGPDSVTELWALLLAASSACKTRLWEFPRLWRVLQMLCTNDRIMSHHLVAHAEEMRRIHGDMPDGFYESVMLPALTNKDPNAASLHQKLKAVWPGREVAKNFFSTLCDHPVALEEYRKICFDNPAFSGLYSFIIGRLLHLERPVEAFVWHQSLLEHGDTPTSSHEGESLAFNLQQCDHAADADAVTADLRSLGIITGEAFESTKGASSIDASKHPLIEAMLAHLRKDREAVLSDEFVSRLVATKFFSLESILQGLQMMNYRLMGPLALRETVLRNVEHDSSQTGPTKKIKPVHVHQAVQKLHRHEVELGKSVFSRLLIAVAEAGKADILSSILESDQHPETLEDLDTQEGLFLYFVKTSKFVDAEKTLWIIRTLDPTRYPIQWNLSNVFLSLAAKHGEKGQSVRMIKGLLRRHEKVEPLAFGAAWKVILQPRDAGSSPFTYDEVNLLAAHLKMMTQSGNRTEPWQWIEVIRRFGMAKKLESIEEICTWLVKWHSSESFRVTHVPFATSGRKPARISKQFLQDVFNSRALQGFLAWGLFCWAATGGSASESRRARSGREKSVDVENCDALWGVRLMRTLRNLGLPFDGRQQDVQTACQHALLRMFGRAHSNSKQTRTVRRAPKEAGLIEYATAMEKIWGEKLFFKRLDGEDDRTRLLKYAQHLQAIEGRKLRKGKIGFWRLRSVRENYESLGFGPEGVAVMDAGTIQQDRGFRRRKFRAARVIESEAGHDL